MAENVEDRKKLRQITRAPLIPVGRFKGTKTHPLNRHFYTALLKKFLGLYENIL